MSELHQNPMELEAGTFECTTCGRELPVANQLTHEVACARMHRENRENPMAQPIIRQSSSSAIPEISNQTQQRGQPMPRREDRRVENKLITCPNCEKSVREQDINSHMDNECLKNETIPCEFCDEGIPMSNYEQHVNSCPRRQENQRNASPNRARPDERQMQHDEEEEEEEHEQDFEDVHHEEPQQRDGSPDHGSSQGGIRGFLRNLAGSAATQLRNLNTAYTEHQEQLRQQREQQLEQRRHEQERQREMLEHMWGQPQVSRNQAPNSQNMPFAGSTGGSRVVRTIERGPGGSIIVRQRVIPANGNPFQMQQHPHNPMEVNPLEMLLGMIGGGQFAGFQHGGNGPMGGAPEEQGLDKETIASLATIKYNKETNKNLEEELKKCPICLDDFEDGQEVKFLWCTHRFHRGCVDTWLDKHTTCPICKKDFKEAEQEYSS